MKNLYIGPSKDIQGVPVPGFGSPCIMCIIIFLITYYMYEVFIKYFIVRDEKYLPRCLEVFVYGKNSFKKKLNF